MFPDPRESNEDGLLCWGGHLDNYTLLEAYSKGVFPWPHEGMPLLWFSPKQRGILDFSELHIPKSLKKFINKQDYKITIDKAFDRVMRTCAQVHSVKHKGTWITEEMLRAYLDFHKKGHAHSLEIWEEGELIGGIYGVFVKGLFSAESMFGLKSNISKLALVKLVEHLIQLGIEWMDIQMVTAVTESLGGRYISQDEFLKRLDRSKAQQIQFYK